MLLYLTPALRQGMLLNWPDGKFSETLPFPVTVLEILRKIVVGRMSSLIINFNQSLLVVITTGFDNYYIIFRFKSGDFSLQRKMQFGHILESFENSIKRKSDRGIT